MMTARDLCLQLANHYSVGADKGDARSAAMAKTLREIAEVVPEDATGDDLALFWAYAQESKPGERHHRAVEARKQTLFELMELAGAAGCGVGSLQKARAIGIALSDHYSSVAARAGAMARTFELETEACQ